MSDLQLPVEHLSYSALRLFCSNPWQFKKNYLLGLWDNQRSITAAVGSAFHKFAELHYKGLPIEQAQDEAIKYLDNIPDKDIDFGKTGSRESARKDLAQAIEFFLDEKPEVGEVLGSEVSVTTNFPINDSINSPLPIKAKSDLVSRLDGGIHIWDWKVVYSHSDKGENNELMNPSYIMQAMFNFETIRAKYGEAPVAMHFMEIKKSKNRNGHKQIDPYSITFDQHPQYRTLFLKMYEGFIRSMANDDYVFLPNFGDMYTGSESWEDFTAETFDFKMPKKVAHKSPLMKNVDQTFVESKASSAVSESMEDQEKISVKLLEFGIGSEFVDKNVGPSVTLYRFKPSRGVRMATLRKHEDDLALATGAKSVRIEAPIKGTNYFGVEVSNESQSVVEWSESLIQQSSLLLPVGADVYGKPYQLDLAKAPHLLVAGATGSGKSVGLNVFINQLTQQNTADEMQLVLIDPKRTEFNEFSSLPHLQGDIITEVEDAAIVLEWAVRLMEERYQMLQKGKARSIDTYAGDMPRVVIVIDELADLLMSDESYTVQDDKTGNLKSNKYSDDIERHILRLAQKSRASGIHLILATQRPSVDVLKGTLKGNLPTRIAYMTATQADSRVILDQPGADQLLGNGDCLLMTPKERNLVRLQGYYIK